MLELKGADIFRKVRERDGEDHEVSADPANVSSRLTGESLSKAYWTTMLSDVFSIHIEMPITLQPYRFGDRAMRAVVLDVGSVIGHIHSHVGSAPKTRRDAFPLLDSFSDDMSHHLARAALPTIAAYGLQAIF
jgi:hypothetical protein